MTWLPTTSDLSAEPLEAQLRETLVVPDHQLSDVIVIDCPSALDMVSVVPELIRDSCAAPVSDQLAQALLRGIDACSDATMQSEHGFSSPEEWCAFWQSLTPMPLLDLPRSIGPAHPYLRFISRGDGTPPEPFGKLATWAITEFNSWGGVVPQGRSCGIRSWRYLRSEYPNERLLHLTARGTRYCFSRGRQHQGQNVMISVDLLQGRAWQRCWDNTDCVVRVADHMGKESLIKAKQAISRPSASLLPTFAELQEFEREHSNKGLVCKRQDGVSAEEPTAGNL